MEPRVPDRNQYTGGDILNTSPVEGPAPGIVTPYTYTETAPALEAKKAADASATKAKADAVYYKKLAAAADARAAAAEAEAKKAAEAKELTVPGKGLIQAGMLAGIGEKYLLIGGAIAVVLIGILLFKKSK